MNSGTAIDECAGCRVAALVALASPGRVVTCREPECGAQFEAPATPVQQITVAVALATTPVTATNDSPPPLPRLETIRHRRRATTTTSIRERQDGDRPDPSPYYPCDRCQRAGLLRATLSRDELQAIKSAPTLQAARALARELMAARAEQRNHEVSR